MLKFVHYSIKMGVLDMKQNNNNNIYIIDKIDLSRQLSYKYVKMIRNENNMERVVH